MYHQRLQRNLNHLKAVFCCESCDQVILKQFEFWPIKRRLDRARFNLEDNMETEDPLTGDAFGLGILSRVSLSILDSAFRDSACD